MGLEASEIRGGHLQGRLEYLGGASKPRSFTLLSTERCLVWPFKGPWSIFPMWSLVHVFVTKNLWGTMNSRCSHEIILIYYNIVMDLNNIMIYNELRKFDTTS